MPKSNEREEIDYKAFLYIVNHIVTEYQSQTARIIFAELQKTARSQGKSFSPVRFDEYASQIPVLEKDIGRSRGRSRRTHRMEYKVDKTEWIKFYKKAVLPF